MKKFLRVFIVAMLIVALAASMSCFATVAPPSPSREDVVDVVDTPIDDLDETEVPLGELPDDISAVTVIKPPAVVINGSAEAVILHEEVEQMVESIQLGLTDAVLVIPQIMEETDRVVVTISAESAALLAEETTAPIILSTSMGTVMLPNSTLGVLAAKADGDDFSMIITMHTPELGEELLAGLALDGVQGDDQVTQVDMMLNGEKITYFDGKALSILLPVTNDGYFQVGGKYPVKQISDNGVVEDLTGTCVASGDGVGVQVTVTHLSTFVVLRAEEPVAGDAAAPEVPTDDIADADVPLVESPQTGSTLSTFPVVMVMLLGVCILSVGVVCRKKFF